MSKKCLTIGIGLMVVVLLVVVSLNNVVGYQSVTSTSRTESPLFCIRTQNAINKGSNILTSNYLGQGLQTISFPLKDNRSALIPEIIDRIQMMNDEEFSRLQSLILSWLSEKQHVSNTDIVNLLNLVRQNSIPKGFDITFYDIIQNRTKPPSYIEFTCKMNIPLCFFMNLITYLVTILSYSFYFIVHLFTLNQCQYGNLQ